MSEEVLRRVGELHRHREELTRDRLEYVLRSERVVGREIDGAVYLDYDVAPIGEREEVDADEVATDGRGSSACESSGLGFRHDGPA